MFSVGKTPNPLYGRTGADGGRPLTVRFEEIRNRALREIPVTDPEYGVVNSMCSEANIDLIFEAIARAKARSAPPEPSPELRAAWNEISRLEHQFNRMVRELREAQQKWLWRAQSDWKHKVLRSLQPDMADDITTINTDWVGARKYPDIITARQRAKAVHEQIKWLEGLSSKVFNAMSFDESPPEVQAVHLCHGLFDDSVELKARITQLEAQLSATQAQLSKLSRKTNPKPRKAA